MLPGQSLDEAIRLNEQILQGNGASKAMAGAQTAWYSNASSAIVNPAILGFVEHSQMVLVPEIHYGVNRTDFFDSRSSTNFGGANIAHLGFLINTYSGNSGWDFDEAENLKEAPAATPLNIGFNFYRRNTFRSRYSISSINPSSSITDYFGDLARGTTVNSYIVGTEGITELDELAYVTYLIDSDSNNEATVGIANGGDVLQSYQQDQSGYINDLEFSLGKRINQHISLGFSAGLTMYNFTRQETITETDTNDVHPYFENLRFQPNQKNSSSGLFFSAGLIYRFNETWSVGFSHRMALGTTILSEYDAFLDAEFKDYPELPGTGTGIERSEIQPIRHRYSIQLPSRTTAGISFTRNSLTVNSDLTFINTGNTDIKLVTEENPNINFQQVQQKIRQRLNGMLNVSLGVELEKKGAFYRSGFGLKNQINISTSPYFTLGYGLIVDNVGIDIALVRQWNNFDYLIYGFETQPPVVNVGQVGTNLVVGLNIEF